MWRRFWRAPRSFAKSSKRSIHPLRTALTTCHSHIPGVNEKIVQLRQRHARLKSSIDHFEMHVVEQQLQLARQNRHRDYDKEEEQAPGPEPEPDDSMVEPLTAEDLGREEEEIRELERKKRGLEDRVNSMGRDLSGVRHAMK